jgi:hypothetical protein
MIAITVLVDGQVVKTASAKSRWELPDVIARETVEFEHDPNLRLEREEKVRNAANELTEVRVHYQRTATPVSR